MTGYRIMPVEATDDEIEKIAEAMSEARDGWESQHEARHWKQEFRDQVPDVRQAMLAAAAPYEITDADAQAALEVYSVRKQSLGSGKQIEAMRAVLEAFRDGLEGR